MVGLLSIHGQSLVTSHSVSKRSIPLTLGESCYSDRKRTAIRFVSNKACRGCQNNLEGVSIITKLKDMIKFSRHKRKKDIRCLPTFLLSPAKSLECNDFSGWFWSSVVIPEQGLSRSTSPHRGVHGLFSFIYMHRPKTNSLLGFPSLLVTWVVSWAGILTTCRCVIARIIRRQLRPHSKSPSDFSIIVKMHSPRSTLRTPLNLGWLECPVGM